jgi:hypothetical protein
MTTERDFRDPLERRPGRDPLEIRPGQDWRLAAEVAGIEAEAFREARVTLRAAGERRARAIVERKAAEEACDEAARDARDIGIPAVEIAGMLGDHAMPDEGEDF